MSAHLTVYAMAIAAERPLRNSELEKARYLSEADIAAGRLTDMFLSRLSDALGGARRHGVRAGRLLDTRESGMAAVGQPASLAAPRPHRKEIPWTSIALTACRRALPIRVPSHDGAS